MSFFGNIGFFGWLAVALIPAVILGLLEKPLKYYTQLISIVFILLVFKDNPIQLLYLLGYYVLQCVLVKGYLQLRLARGKIVWQYRLCVAFSMLPLVVSKLAPLISLSAVGFLGISYLTFRALQVIIEIYDGIITEVSLGEFTGYLLFFPCISSGPIDRSRRFHEDYIRIYTRQEYAELLGDGLWKLLLGMVYKFVLAGIVGEWLDMASYGTAWYANIGYAYTYGLHMFFDFAGYSLMAVGTSYIFGIQTPGNFRAPFISKDIKDFWDRWHITLSHWFRDFIFSRFLMTAIKKKWFHTRLQGAVAGFIVNMSIMGVWHGISASYILYGIYHGLLLAITEIYQKKAKFYKKNKGKSWYQACSWFVTLQLVMFGFFIFSGKLIEIL